MAHLSLTSDLRYIALFSLVLILPKIFLRFKIPSGITALIIGIIAGSMESSIQNDQLFRFLAQIGITSLFVFAGLEVDFEGLKQDKKYLTIYLLKSLLFLGIITLGIHYYFELNFQNSLIFSLGIFTPSAGFIITSLHSFNISEDQEYWIKSKAISKEITAVLLLFFALQSNDPKSLGVSLIFFISLLVILPYMFRLFFKFISPYTPNSEVPFLVVLSLIAGVISKELGTYYLVGAFVVGLIAGRFKKEIFKDDEEALFNSLSTFFNIFLPFYFFYVGLKISLGDLSLQAFGIALAFILIFVPLRLLIIRFSVRYILKELTHNAYKISLSLMPTLIFGLVIAGILTERGTVPKVLIYALMIYTLFTSLLPSLLFSVKKTNKEQDLQKRIGK